MVITKDSASMSDKYKMQISFSSDAEMRCLVCTLRTQLAGAVRPSGNGDVIQAGAGPGHEGDAGGQVADVVHGLLDKSLVLSTDTK